MAHQPRRVDPARSDYAATGEYLAARELVAKADGRARTVPTVESGPPLRQRCTGPGCNLSKSAFPSTADFDAHRALCEVGTPIGHGGTRVPAEPGVDTSRPDDHGIVRPLP